MSPFRLASVTVLVAALWGGGNASADTHPPTRELAKGATTDTAAPPHEVDEARDPSGSEPNETDGESQEGQQPTDIDELERRIEVLAEELEQLRSGEGPQHEVTDEDARALGLAPSAALLYRKDRGVSIAGYGEMLYENFAAENENGATAGGGAQADFLRAILYFGYRFSDKFLFNSEIEIEHADEVFLEFAYIDYLASENLGIRGGLVLLPMGLVNEFHEPSVFIGTKRPETERVIIPTTWRENGFGIHGSAGKFVYRAFVINGLDASGFSASGIRGGRQKGSKALADDLAFTARIDVAPTFGVFLGASLYTGGSGQGQVVVDERTFKVRTTLFDLHAQVQMRGFDFRGLYARSQVDEAAELNQWLGLEGTEGVAKTMQGGYLQVGYDVLSRRADTRASLLPYYRFEKVDTQSTMPDGYEASGATNRTINTIGVELKPIPNVVLKVDYQIITNAAKTGRNQLNVNLGYAF